MYLQILLKNYKKYRTQRLQETKCYFSLSLPEEKRVFDATVLKGDVFASLNDPAIFNNFKIVHGVITWMDEDIDCAPEYMYEHSYTYLSNTEEVPPYPDEIAAINAYKSGEPEYQPSISQEELMKELGLN